MSKVTYNSSSLCPSSALLTFMVVSVLGGPHPQDRTWAYEFYPDVVASLFPLNPIDSPDPYLFEFDWTVVLNVRPDEPDLEWSVLFKQRRDLSVEAQIKKAKGESIFLQLVELSAQQPNLSVEEAVSLVLTETESIPDHACPQVRTMLEDLERLGLGSRPPDGIIIHGTRVEFVSRWLDNTLTASFWAQATPSERDLEDPLLAWVHKVRNELVEGGCGARQ